uniref:DM13 domain-containing protein n=1 Tax=Trichuris muris TaxID=70415 RepID=A0A5S6QRA9_TRIMR
MLSSFSSFANFGFWLAASLAYCGADHYFGRFIGLLAEGRFADSKPFYSCRGLVWIPDKYRFVVSAFTFQPPLESVNNVTFWIGPRVSTEDIDRDLKPSANGIYLKPRVMAVPSKLLRSTQVRMAKAPPNPAELVYNEIMKYAKIESRNNETNWLPLNDNHHMEVPINSSRTSDVEPVIELLVSDGEIIHVTNPSPLVEPMITQRVETSIAVSTDKRIRHERSLSLNDVWETIFKLANGRKHMVDGAESRSDPAYRPSQTLDWYRGDQIIILDLPKGKAVTDFLWLSVYDHERQVPIATALIPNGPSFSFPEPRKLAGFRAVHKAYKVHSEAVELVDQKIIRIHNFSCPQCPPGTWVMAGEGAFPNSAGYILPIYVKNGTYDCDYLSAKREDAFLTVHLPDALTIMDISWISVYNVPQRFSLGHVHIFQQNDIPAHLSTDSVPRCVLPRS